MAKNQTQPAVESAWVVFVNGGPEAGYPVTATSAQEAIDKVIAETESLRDKRNFTARPKSVVDAMNAGKHPPLTKVL